MQKPALGFWAIWSMSFGFFGIQIAFALQGANMSRIFQTLGANLDTLAILWLAGPVTGLLVQPIVGHYSDRTWNRLGRRRPYFLAGAILTTLSLLIMPNAPLLWVAAVMLWVLDASINISMEPFRAFVGDMLPSRQRTRGFAMQTIFIGAGAFLASLAPWALTELGVSNTAEPGQIPDSVRYAFYIGAAALFASVGWTVISTREYSPEQLAAFREPPGLFREDAKVEAAAPDSAGHYLRTGASFLMAGLLASAGVFWLEGSPQLYVLTVTVTGVGVMFLVHALQKLRARTDNLIGHVVADLNAMPKVMRRLAVVQFFSWFALFIMWVYATPAVTAHHYGTLDPASALYNTGANRVGTLFAIYNVVAAAWALALPFIAARLNRRWAHGLSLLIGAAAFASFYLLRDPDMLFVSMIGIGIAWGSILTMPYAILSDSLPAKKMGIYMGIFNFFIVLPQMVVASTMGPILSSFLGGQAILTFLIGAGALTLAALALTLVPGRGQIIPADRG